MRLCEYADAIRLYQLALTKYPSMRGFIEFNLSLAERKIAAMRPPNSSFTAEAPKDDAAELANDALLSSFFHTARQCDFVSFDIWDTVLRRNCHPDEIKLRSARALWLAFLPIEKNGQSHIHLYHARKQAENTVADSDWEYKYADSMAEWLSLTAGAISETETNSFLEYLLACEVAAEVSATSVDDTAHTLLKQLKDTHRIIAISDFYHSEDTLKQILSANGVDHFFESVFVSCEYGLTKRSGRLYHKVLEMQAVSNAKLMHFGDNIKADYAKAIENGIRAVLYVNDEQEQARQAHAGPFTNYLNGDFSGHERRLCNTLFSKLNLDFEADANKLESPNHRIAGNTLSLAVVPFVAMCLQQALSKGADSIFFCTREGVLFKSVYDCIVNENIFDLPAYPQSRLLYVSRRATFAASLRDFTPSELMRMWNLYSIQSVDALSCSCNFDQDLVSDIFSRHGIDSTIPIKYPWLNADFVRALESPEFQSYALSEIAKQRRLLEAHFLYVGYNYLDPSTTNMLVDIGWRGTIQDNISYLTAGRVHGAYLALKKLINDQPPNTSKTGFLSDENIGSYFNLGDVAALEFILNCTGGSVVGYEDDGSPIRQIFEGEESVAKIVENELHTSICEGACTVANYIRDHGLIADDLRPLARKVVKLYLASPPACIADLFSNLEHNETFGTGDVDVMSESNGYSTMTSLDGSDLHYSLVEGTKGRRWADSMWRTTEFQGFSKNLKTSQKLNLPAKNGTGLSQLYKSKTETISIFCPPPLAGSGGHRTIFNLAKGLERAGHNVDIFFDGVNADFWYVEQELKGYNIRTHTEWYSGIRPIVAMATIAYSAQYVREFFNDVATAYFIQDYEADFNPLSDGYVKGQNSYAQGHIPVCVGHWLPHILNQQFGIKSAYGGLGADTSVYFRDKTIPKKRQIAFLYQPEKWRRMPNMCIEALSLLSNALPDIDVVVYGSNVEANLPFKATYMGLVNDLSELNRIYNESSVGLCLSLTNPSRIPIEYMACGCVPVDLYRYNNLFDNEDGCAVLAYQSSQSLADAMISLFNDPLQLSERSDKCVIRGKKRSLDWEIDSAVNAVTCIASGQDFGDVPTPCLAYKEPAFVSRLDESPEVMRFCDFQLFMASN